MLNLSCFSGWSQEKPKEERVGYFNGHKYVFVPDQVRWRTAKEKSEEMGGHLVTITSKEEQSFIEDFLKAQKDYQPHTWIGFSDDQEEGKWVWVTDEKTEYTNWSDGNPSNWYDTQNFAWIGYSGDGKWDDHFEGVKLFYIVEYDNYSASNTGRKSTLRLKQ